jgi:hypothetical protein
VETINGVLAERCGAILKEFFEKVRTGDAAKPGSAQWKN